MKSPLPVRDGVNATRLRLPVEGPWSTALDYMLHRWGHVDPDGIRERFDRGEIVGEGGVRLHRGTPLSEHTFIWYYRTLPAEQRLPVEIGILHQDENILVVDKPHFLPTTPGGTYISESALVRLRVLLDIPDLIPMHRLDRLTAGVLLFSTNPATRGRYQVLFEKRRVQKEYEAIAPVDPEHEYPLLVRNRMVKSRSYLLAETVAGEPNTETRIQLLETRGGLGRYLLEPHTGKTHQLRVHMASLGIGILHDPFYPVLLDKAPDDLGRPLQLLARGVRFTDPLSGRPVEYRSRLELSEWAAASQRELSPSCG
jgi:tRNA pseudouridine32 synthase/23S rRNA pseudouridine746 synthase